MRRLAALSAVALLAGCNSSEPADKGAQDGQASAAPDLPGAVDRPTEAELALLEAEDCRTVAEAYLDAIARRDFGFAEEFWNDPVVDAARLEALFSGYERPDIEIADVMEEGAAGTVYCTVTGALTDGADPERLPRSGKITLRRVNDVPGATAEQLRWRLDSSTYIEPMQRARRGVTG